MNCTICNSPIQREQSQINKSIKRGQKYFYCSKQCQYSGRKGYNLIKLYASNRRDDLSLYRWYIRLARNRNKEFDIDANYLKDLFERQQGKCVYTKVSLSLWDYRNKGGNDKLFTASLDRIDSSKGYVKGNVQFISMAANLCKHTMSHEDMLKFCELIIENHRS